MAVNERCRIALEREIKQNSKNQGIVNASCSTWLNDVLHVRGHLQHIVDVDRVGGGQHGFSCLSRQCIAEPRIGESKCKAIVWTTFRRTEPDKATADKPRVGNEFFFPRASRRNPRVQTSV